MLTATRPASQYPRRAAAPSSPTGSGWKPDLLVVCVAIYIATAVGRLHEVFPVLGYFKPTLLSAGLALGLYLLDRSRMRAPGRLLSPTATYVIGLVVWGALTVPGALNQGAAFHGWLDLAWSIVMCLVVAGSVRRTADIERLVLIYFAVTAVYVGVVLSRFQLGAESWRLGRLYYYDANDLATLIATALPLGLHCFLVHRRPVERVLAGIGLAILAVGLIRSGSRGGFLACLAVTAFVLLRVTTIPARSRLIGVAVILLFVLGTASDKYWAQMQTIIHPHEDYNLTAEEGRIQVWERGLGYMTSYPVFGVGVRNFPVAEGTISPQARRQERGLPVRWGAAHNTYIQIGAELGIPGLLLFLGLLWSAFGALRRAARRRGAPTREVASLAQTLMAALVGFAVGAIFLSLAYTDMLYMLVAFSLGLAKAARAEAMAPQALPAR
jgi:O-antigen ligase